MPTEDYTKFLFLVTQTIRHVILETMKYNIWQLVFYCIQSIVTYLCWFHTVT